MLLINTVLTQKYDHKTIITIIVKFKVKYWPYKLLFYVRYKLKIFHCFTL